MSYHALRVVLFPLVYESKVALWLSVKIEPRFWVKYTYHKKSLPLLTFFVFHVLISSRWRKIWAYHHHHFFAQKCQEKLCFILGTHNIFLKRGRFTWEFCQEKEMELRLHRKHNICIIFARQNYLVFMVAMIIITLWWFFNHFILYLMKHIKSI